jgi:hypothetical protein
MSGAVGTSIPRRRPTIRIVMQSAAPSSGNTGLVDPAWPAATATARTDQTRIAYSLPLRVDRDARRVDLQRRVTETSDSPMREGVHPCS